jgi:hypothetical protein
VCDEWYIEPYFADDNGYLEFCLTFCKEHNIELAVPYKRLSVFCRNRSLFERTGTKVLVEPNVGLFDTLNDKIAAYRFIESVLPRYAPPFTEIKTKEEFIDAYTQFIKNYDQVCFKAPVDEGASSFRIVPSYLRNIESGDFLAALYEHTISALTASGKDGTLLLMPYFTGVEISIDVLCTEQGNIIIPRKKLDNRHALITYDEDILLFCETLLKHAGLVCPCNIQIKYHKESPYLLEVNTRMSGGVGLSCLGTGVNIPYIAVCQALGIYEEWHLDRKAANVSWFEMPILL